MLKPVGAEVHALVEAIIFESIPTGRRAILSVSTRTHGNVYNRAISSGLTLI